MPGMTTTTATTTKTAREHGAEDLASLVTDAQIAGDQRDADEIAAEAADEAAHEPDEALINAIGWSGVEELAGITKDDDEHTAALAWCVEYNAGWRAAALGEPAEVSL